jgi:hypothetical protein
MFDYFTDCTLGQVPFLADGENYCHNEHYLKGRLTDDAAREYCRNLRIDVFSRLIIDAINRKLVGARVLIIGVMSHIIFPSIIEEARSMAIDHFKEQGIDVEFDLQFIISPHFCSVLHGLNQEELAKMDNAVMQSQGNLLRDVNYFQQRWSHARNANGDKMKNLITYLKTMNVEDKMNTRLDMLARDGSPGHIHMINYFTKYRNEIFQYAIIKSDAKPSSIEELTILHLHSYLGMRGYIKGIKAMSAEERMSASEKGYENGIWAMSTEAKMGAYENGIGAMSADARMVAYENGLGSMSAEERMAASEKGYENGLGSMSAEERMAASKKGYENGLGAMSAEKNKMRMCIVWEEKYAEFVSYDGTPKNGTPLFNWQQNQLSNGHASLNIKIRKEKAENKGSTIWSERRVKLANCVEQKRRE